MPNDPRQTGGPAMTDTQALQRLIEDVEAGQAGEGWSHYDSLPPAVWTDVKNAHNGSLDAAKSLHDAVVPEWVIDRMRIWPSSEEPARVSMWGTHDERGERWHHPTDGRVDASGNDLARAWLLAILRAMLAEREGGRS